MFPEEQAVRQWRSSAPVSVAGRVSAALTGLHHHVRELLHLGGPPDIVKDGQGLQVLGHTARRGRRFRIQGVVQAQHLGEDTTFRCWKATPWAWSPPQVQGTAVETEPQVDWPLMLLRGMSD